MTANLTPGAFNLTVTKPNAVNIKVTQSAGIITPTTTTPPSLSYNAQIETSLEKLTDVHIVNPANNDVLTYSNGVWFNSNSSGGGSTAAANAYANAIAQANVYANNAYNNAVAYVASQNYVNASSITGFDPIGSAANAYSNSISYVGNQHFVNTSQLSSNLSGYATTISVTSNAATAYSNAIAQANIYANNAYNNAIAYSGNAALAYSNAVTYITNQSYANTLQVTSNAATAYSNAIAYSGNAALAYSNAIAQANIYANNAYNNATAFAANGSTISSGTVVLARLDANVVSNTQLSSNLANYSNSTQTATLAATAYSNAIAYSGNAALAYANVIALSYANTLQLTSNSATAYSNAIAQANIYANNAYNNAVAYAASNTTVYSTFAQNTAVYANIVSYSSSAYSNAIGYSGNAVQAYSNAIAQANIYANNAYNNAVAYAASNTSVYSTFAQNTAVYANILSYSSNAYSNAISYSGNAALAYSNAIAQANIYANNAYNNAIAYSGNAAQAYSNSVTYITNQSFANTLQLTSNSATAYSNAIAQANIYANNAYNNAIAFASNGSNVNTGTISISYLDTNVVSNAQLSSNLSNYVNTSGNYTISGNLNFTGTNNYFTSNTYFGSSINIASGSVTTSEPVITASQTWNSPSIATTGASGTGTVATIKFATQTFTYPIGSQVTVSSITPTGYNGTFAVTAANTTSVSYNNTTTGAQTVAGTVIQAFRGISVNVTGTSYSLGSGTAGSLLMYLSLNGASRLNLDSFGNLTVAGTVQGSVIQTAGVVYSPYFAFGSSLSTYITSPAISTTKFGLSDSATPVQQTLTVQSPSNVLNTSGNNWIIQGSKSTGTALGGAIVFQTTPAGASGNNQNTLVNAAVIDANLNITASNTIFVGNSSVNVSINSTSFSGTINPSNITSGTFTTGFNFTSYNAGVISSGTFTPSALNGNYQYYTANGAHTIAAPSNDCALTVLIINSSGAGAITFSGYTVGAYTGDSLTVTNGNQFLLNILRINGTSTYTVKALQ